MIVIRCVPCNNVYSSDFSSGDYTIRLAVSPAALLTTLRLRLRAVCPEPELLRLWLAGAPVLVDLLLLVLSPNLADLELLRLESGLAIVRLRLRAAGSCPADMKGLFAPLAMLLVASPATLLLLLLLPVCPD